MKLLYFALFFSCLTATTAQNNEPEYFYWYQDAKQPLLLNKELKYFVFPESFPLEKLNSLSKEYEVISYSIDNTVESLQAIEKQSELNTRLPWALIRNVTGDWNSSSILSTNKIYEGLCFSTEQEKNVGMSDLFYVKITSPEEYPRLQEMCVLNQVQIIGQNKYMPQWYTLSCVYSGKNALELANEFYKNTVIVESIPDFMADANLQCVNDPLFSSQYSLDVINSCGAWEITTGEPLVNIAVFDTQVLNHGDLAPPSASFNTQPDVPDTEIVIHGTHVAGIIFAEQDNNYGISGIAPECTFTAVRNSLMSNKNSVQTRADGINWAWSNGAYVINNSWHATISCPMLDDAIIQALTQGRFGKGTVVVFTSGNLGAATVGYPAIVDPRILVVGATNILNNRAYFSSYGNELDVVAPGVDIISLQPQNTTEFTTLSGTSQAAPQVSALAGLILSLNPCFTVQEVSDIIESSAQKLGGVNYQTTTGRDNGTWHEEMGYGVIDLEAALSGMTNEYYYFLQNITESGETLIPSFGNIRAGENVTQNLPAGPYVISSSADVELKATRSITLEDGFTALHGCDFLAHIKAFNGDCDDWHELEQSPPSLINEDQSSIKNQYASNNNLQYSKLIFYPNPFNQQVSVKYDLVNPSDVIIQVHNMLGQLITTKYFKGQEGSNTHMFEINTTENILYVNFCVDGTCTTSKLVNNNE